MKMIKRTLCMLLSLVMVIGMFPMQAFATVDGLEMIPVDIPMDVPMDVPMDIPMDIPVDIPMDIPVDVPMDIPVDVPMDIPMDIPMDVPMDIPVDIPMDIPVDVPMDIPVDVPMDIPVDVPMDIPVDVPAQPELLPAPVAATVYFNCSPARLSLFVYDAYGVPVEAQYDGSYLLMPGVYTYCAYCEGCLSAEGVSFAVPEGQQYVFVDVLLTPMESIELPQEDLFVPELPVLPEDADAETEIVSGVVYASFNGAAAVMDAQGNLLINEDNFPDAAFRAYVTEAYDTNGSGRLSPAQVAAIRTMNCTGMGIESMAGIEHFTALTELTCSGNALTTLDVSRSTALVTLDCTDNKLTSLNVKSSALTELYCSKNKLTELNVMDCPALAALDCSNNALTGLYVGSNYGLTRLNCSSNRIEVLDVHNTSVTELYCGDNLLTELDLSGNPELSVLYCESNRIGALDLSKNTALLYAVVNNQSPVIKGEWSYGKLVVNMAALTGDLSLVDEVIGADYDSATGIVTLGEAGSALKTSFSYVLVGSSYELYADATVEVPEHEDYISIDETSFPDAAFRKYISDNIAAEGSNVLSVSQIAAVTEINVPSCGIASLKGIEKFGALTTLRAGGNKLASLDLSANAALTAVEAGGQSVDAQGIWNGDKLTVDLAALVGTGNMANVSAVSGLNGLKASVDAEGLVTVNLAPGSASTAAFSYVYSLGAKGAMDVTVTVSVPEFDGSKLLINEENFPDAAFRAVVSGFDTNSLGYLTQSQLDAVKVIDCSGKGIASLKGIENFKNLTELVCSGNALSALDLSANTALLTLDCSGNSLSALDLSANTALTTLECSANALSALDLSANTKLSTVYCSGNALSSLKVSGLAALTSLDCSENALTALDLGGCTGLKSLRCEYNSLSALDLSACTALTELRCAYNALTSLDVSACTALTSLRCEHNCLAALDVSANAALSTLVCGDQDSQRNAFWQDDDLFFDLAALVGKDNLAKVSGISAERYDAATGIVTIQTAEDSSYFSEFSYNFKVVTASGSEKTMNVNISVIRPERPAGGSCGDNLDWNFDPATGSIIVTGSGDMEDFDAGSAPWDEYKTKIEKIVISDGVTSIADNAFAGFTAASSVTIPSSVTTIGDGAFAGMSALESVSIPASVTSIGKDAFDGCTALEKIEFTSKTAPACDWSSMDNLGATVVFPASNNSWLDAIDSYQASGKTELDWRIAGTSTYGEHIKALVETFNDAGSRTISVTEDAYVPAGITVSAKVKLVVEKDVSLELKGALTVNGSASIAGNLAAGNLTVNGSLETLAGSSISANDLVVNGVLNIVGCTVSAKTLKVWSGAQISISSAGKLAVSDSVTFGTGTRLIAVNAEGYSSIKDAITENLGSYTEVSGAVAETDAQLAELLGMRLGKARIETRGQLKLSADTVILAGVELVVNGSLSTESFNLINRGSLTLKADLSVGAGKSFVNEDSIILAGGKVIRGEGAVLRSENGGELVYAEGFSPALDELSDVIALGLRNLVISSSAALSADLTLPSTLSVEINGATLTVPENIRLTRNGSSIVLKNGAKLVIDGTYDGPEIAMYAGCAVEPAEKISYTHVEGDITYVGFNIALAETVSITDKDGKVISGSEIYVADMSESVNFQLMIKVEPENASSRVTWKSSAPTVATVSETGLVTFLKPGQVSFTATTVDAAQKTATVNMEVIFAGIDAMTRFTAAAAVETMDYVQPMSLGLQKGDRVEMLIYGTDKTQPLPNSLFEFYLGNTTSERFVSVDENGVITALEAGGSASVKAALRDDPLGRSVALTVKTIPVLTGRINVIPKVWSEGITIEGVDANGDLCRDSGLAPVSSAIFLDKVPAGTKATDLPTITAALEVKGTDGNPMEIVRGKHTWASTGGTIASVKENTDGTATITVKANVDGACTITATSKDASKAQGGIAVYVRDYAPRLAAATLSLDSQKLGMAELGVIESYGASIVGVEYLDKYDAKTKTYSSTGAVAVEVFDIPGTDPDALTPFTERGLRFTANQFIKNGTLNGQLNFTLSVPGAEGSGIRTVPVPFKLNIKNAAPVITLKQLTKLNLFYSDSVSLYSVEAKNELVERVLLVGTDLTGMWDGSGMNIFHSDPNNIPAKPNTKVTFEIYLAGYANPVEKAVTVGAVNTKPVLTLEPTSLAINTAAVKDVNTFSVLLREKSGIVLELGESEVNLVSGPAGFTPVGDGQYVRFTVSRADIEALKSGKLSFTVQDDSWASPVTVNLNITKSGTAATAKLSKTSLKINSAYAESYDEATLMLSYANMSIGDVGVTVVPAKETAGLIVTYENGKLSARIEEGAVVNAGSYSYKLVFADDVYKPISFTVVVSNAPPAVKLSKTSVNLSSSYVTQTDLFTVLPVDVRHSVVSVDEPSVKSTGAAALEADKIGFEVMGTTVRVFIKDADKAPKAGSYSFNVKARLSTENGEADAKLLTLTVKVAGNNPTAKLSKTSVTLNNVFTDYTESVQVLPTNTKAGHNVIFTSLSAHSKPTATNDAEIEKIEMAFDFASQSIVARIKDEYKADPPKAGSYSFTINGAIDTDGTQLGEGYFKPLTLSVKVVNTMPKLTLSATTLSLNTAAGLAGMENGMISFVVPAGYEVVKTKIENIDPAAAKPEAEKIDIPTEVNGGSIFASLDENNLPKAASYKFRATPYVRIIGTQGEGTAMTPINFTVRVYANAKYSATVSASGKLDASLRQTSAITYTLTKLTNISGEVRSAALSGQDADKFVLGPVELNAKGQPTVKLYMRDDVNYATNATYKIQLNFALGSTYSENLVVSTNVLSVKVSSTALKLTAVTKQQSIYQSQSRSRIVYYTIDLTGPAGAAIGSIEPGVTGLLQQSLVNEYTNVYPVISADGRSAIIKVLIKDTSKLSANRTYTLPLLIRGAGQAANVNPAKLNLSLKVFK